MLISKQDAKLFFKLQKALLIYGASKMSKNAGIFDANAFKNSPLEKWAEARDYVMENISLIQQYTNENPDNFLGEELALIQDWKNAKMGDFIVERHLKNYSIFLDVNDDKKAYGVLGLTQEFTKIMPFFPIWITGVLLPWKNQIVCDGLFRCKLMHFGGGIRSTFKEQYLIAKKLGIITSLETEYVPTLHAKARGKLQLVSPRL